MLNTDCLRACVVSCDCAIAILDHLEFVVSSSRSTVSLCETPRTLIAVIRVTALPGMTIRDLQNLRNLPAF